MKVYDAAPPEWAETKAKAEVEKAAAPQPKPVPIAGYDWSKPETYKDPGALEAWKEQSRTGGVLAGTERPQSLSEGALQAVGSIPFMMGSVPTQMAVGGARAGLQAAMRGEDPTFPALADAATVGLFGAVPKVAGHVLGRFAKPAIKREEFEAAKAAGGEAAEKIGRDVAWLLPELETFQAKELWGMAKEWGPAQIRRAFSSALVPIEERLDRAITAYRTASTAGPPKLNVPTLSKQPIGLETAVEGLIEAGKETRGAVRNEILASLKVLDPSGKAGDLFTQAMKVRAAGYTYVNTIAKGLDKSGNLDPEKLAAFINKNADKLARYAGDYWPKLEAILLRGGKAPVEVGKSATAGPAPSALAKGARTAQKALEAPGTRTGLGAASLTPLGESGTTAGAATIAATPAAHLLRHVPGGRLVLGRGGLEEGE